MCTGSLGGGRRPARKRASSDPRGSVKTLALPPRSPNLNAYAERWVRSVREECLAKLILLGEGSLRRTLRVYEALSFAKTPAEIQDGAVLGGVGRRLSVR